MLYHQSNMILRRETARQQKTTFITTKQTPHLLLHDKRRQEKLED